MMDIGLSSHLFNLSASPRRFLGCFCEGAWHLGILAPIMLVTSGEIFFF